MSEAKEKNVPMHNITEEIMKNMKSLDPETGVKIATMLLEAYCRVVEDDKKRFLEGLIGKTLSEMRSPFFQKD